MGSKLAQCFADLHKLAPFFLPVRVLVTVAYCDSNRVEIMRPRVHGRFGFYMAIPLRNKGISRKFSPTWLWRFRYNCTT